jgi:hypothetical protein
MAVAISDTCKCSLSIRRRTGGCVVVQRHADPRARYWVVSTIVMSSRAQARDHVEQLVADR